MSLLTDSFEEVIMIDKVTVPDGTGSMDHIWKDGASFGAAIILNTSTEVRIAEQAGAKSIYTVTTSRKINLQFHDIIKRIRDGKVFRITSDGDDNLTPKMASLDMRQVTAEEYILT